MAMVIIGADRSPRSNNSQKNVGPFGPALRNSKPYGTIFNWKNRAGELVM